MGKDLGSLLIGLLLMCITGTSAATPYDSLEVKKAVRKAQRLLYAKPDTAERIIKEILFAPNAELSRRSEMLLCLTLGGICFHLQKIDECEKHSRRALFLAKETKDPKAETNALNNIGNCFYVRSDLKKALVYYEQSLEIEERFGMPNMTTSYLNIGMVFQSSENYNRALHYYQKAIGKKALDGRKVKKGSSALTQLHASVNLSILLGHMGRHADALAYADSALVFAREKNSREGIGRSFTLQAQHLFFLKGAEEALPAADSALAYLSPEHPEYLTAANHKTKALLALGRPEEAIRTLAPLSLREDDFTMQNRDLFLTLSQLKKSIGVYRESLLYFEKYNRIKDTLTARENRKELQKQLIRFESKQKESEIRRLKHEAEVKELRLHRTQLGAGVLAIFLVFGGLTAQLFYSRKQFRNRQAVLEAELSRRRAQMNPHFFFNVLMAVKTMVIRKKALEASRGLSKFASLMRRVMESADREFHSLEDEISFLKEYLEVQQLRFCFQTKWQLSEEILTEELRIPILLLQPFAENAVEHGLRQLNDSSGTLTLHFEMSDEQILFVSIRDNGVGRAAAAGSNSSKATFITEERAKLYKNLFRFEIKDLHDDDGKATGTEVCFFIRV